MECYVMYLDASNNFRETKKNFRTYEDAVVWVVQNFENPSMDFIRYY